MSYPQLTIKIILKEKQYTYEFINKTIYQITEDIKKHLKELERLNQWQH